MKKLMVFGTSLLLAIVFISLVCAIRINEVESNPEGSDAKNEWIELYSENEIDLDGWRIENGDQQSKELEGVFQGYIIINFSAQWLDNSEESLSLYEGDVLRDSFTSFEDSYNDNRTWQYCDGDWSFLDSSKNKENDCEEEENNNSNEENNNSNEETTEQEIYLELEGIEDDIQNGEEFDIDVLAFNLKDKEYDIRLYIYNKNGDVISEIYNEEEDKWKSGDYFITKFFQGPGNETETATLRIKESYSDFSGEASIRARIRATGTSPIIVEKGYPIEILEKEANTEKNSSKEDKEEITAEQTELNKENNKEIETSKSTGNVIKLGNREVVKESVNETREEGKILYESSNEIIKKYSIYGLNLILIGIIIFLLISFKKKQNQE